MPLVVLSLLAAYRYIDDPRLRRAAVLGLAVGLVTLTRSDGIVLFAVLALPVVLVFGRRRLPAVAVCALGTLVLVGPWVARNWHEFDRFPLLSTNSGYTVVATNCSPLTTRHRTWAS